MARSTPKAAGDSLELLLDTICNVFGGIILMAILVVIQTQATVVRIPQDSPRAMEQRLAEAKLRHDVARLGEERSNLKRQRQILDDTYRSSVSPQTGLLLRRREEFVDAVEKAAREIAKLQAAEEEHEALLPELEKQGATLDDGLRQIEKDKDRLAEQIRNAKRFVTKKVRLPRQHRQAAYIQVHCIVVGRRFYPVESAHVTRTPVPGTAGTRLTPKPNAGYSAPRKGKNTESFLSMLSGCSARRHFISFWVCGNSESFESFQELRAVAVEKGFEYNVAPYAAKEGLVLFPGVPPVE